MDDAIKIPDLPADSSVTGGEKLPVSDGGVTKYMTADQLRDFVISALGDAPVVPSTDLQNDSVYIERSGETKRLNGAVLADAIIANALAKTGIVEPNGNEKFVIDDSGTEKTMTLSQMKSYIAGNIGDIFAGAGVALPLGASDLMLVSQGGTGAKATLGSLSSFVLGGFASFLASCVPVLNLQDTDKVCVLSGGVMKTVTVRELRALTGGDVIGPTTTTDGKIPQWDSTQKKLKDGLTLRTEIRATGTADNQSIPTEAAVRAAIHSTVEGGYAKISGTPTAGNIPLWHDGESVEDGKSVATSVRGALASDDAIPTEKAVREALDEKIDAPSSAPTDGSVPRWNEGVLDASLDVKETVRTSALASHGAIATEKAVRTALDEKADTTALTSLTGRVSSVETSLNGKASAADLTSLAQTVNGKASQAALEELAESVDQKGNVGSSGQKTAGSLTSWNAAGKLVDGKAVSTEIPSSGASDDAVPTEKAVKDLFDTFDGASAPDTVTAGNIPQWNQDRSLSDGLAVRTSVRDAANASNLHIPTEKAVRDAVDQLVKGPQSHTEDAIPQWGAANELKPGKSVVTTLPSNATDAQIPTAKAVRDALPSSATAQSAGLMAAADKAKLDGLPNLGAVAEIGSDLDDTDTLIVKDNDTTWRKMLITRLWTYIMGKLSSFKIDALAAADDTTKLDSSASRHGLCPKLSGNGEQFLAGDGTFKVPQGSDDFTGTDGVDDGVHGLVPAPTAADANKFLNADGTWATPPSAAGVDIAGSTAVEAPTVNDALYVYQPGNGEYRKLTVGQLRSLIFGTERADTVFIPAGAMAPSTSDGATGGTIQFENATHDTMVFGNTVDTSAEFSVVLPDDWNLGAIKAKVLWTVYDSTKAQAGQYVGFNLGVTASDDGDAISDAPLTENAIADQVLAANELHRTVASGEIVPDGTAAKGAMLHFKLTRDADYAGAGSAMPTDAYVLGVLIQFKRTVETQGW